MKQLIISTLLITLPLSISQASYWANDFGFQQFSNNYNTSRQNLNSYGSNPYDVISNASRGLAGMGGYSPYNPMIQSIASNPAVANYIQEERSVPFNGNINQYNNLFSVNKLIIRNPIIDQNIENINFSTIQELDFSESNLDIANNFFNAILKINDQNGNQTLVSLKRINFGDLEPDYNLLTTIRNVCMQLNQNDNALVRLTQITDDSGEFYVAPVYVFVDLNVLENLQNNDPQAFQDIIQPSEDRFPTVYMSHPYEENLPRFRLYIMKHKH